MSSTITVIAAVVDTENMILYKTDGSTVRIPQGDPRIQKILDQHLADLENGKPVQINMEELNHYYEMEQATSGVVRFFQVAKRSLKNLFSSEEDKYEPNVAPVGTYGQTVNAVEPTSGMRAATNEIMQGAQRVKAVTSIPNDETIVAVIDGVTIPGIENLDALLKHANRMKSYGGIVNLLKRVAKVIERRQHSMADLVKFLEHSDLPIAEDGSIIAYKLLRSKSDGSFVDCHSGNVVQRVGSYVCMEPEMVDPDRRRDCSNGLHIASRSYLRSFHGDVCVIAKIAPEDVIAVPMGDARKVRVCGYHILAVLSPEAMKAVKDNRPMTHLHKDQQVLQAAIEGRFAPPSERVMIGGARGSQITRTLLSGSQGVTPVGLNKEAANPPKATTKAIAVDDTSGVNNVQPKDVVQKKAEAKKNKPAPIGGARSEEAQRLMNQMVSATSGSTEERQAAQALYDFKKKKKVSWTKLGFSEDIQGDVQKILSAEAKGKAGTNGNGATAKPKATPKPKVKAKPKAKPAPKAKAPAKQKAKSPKKKAPAKPQEPMTRNEEARHHFNQKHWNTLVEFKRKKKVSWSKLGFNAKEEATILKATQK